jgi:hypothetical protein
MSEQARPDIEAIITKYLELRDAVEAINAKAKADAAVLKEAMSGIEAYMMKQAIETGQTNFGVKGVGTAFITTETHCSVADWNAVVEFAKANNMWDLLTKGVSKTVVAQYLEKTEQLPPGVNWSAHKVIQIRRGKA